MEPVTLVLTALLTGGAAGASGVASAAVMDAYGILRSRVLRRLDQAGTPEEDGNALIADAPARESQRNRLGELLAQAGVDEPTTGAARHLLALLEQQNIKFAVDASEARGVNIGENATQHNTFN